jgi:hypothetical protein
LDQRASEALKLGFDTLFTAAHPGLKSNAFPGLHVVPVQKMEHLVSALFG